MTVSTRSQVISSQSQNDRKPRTRQRNQETDDQIAVRDRHHGLREKLGALTLFYEHQKQALKTQSLNPEREEERRFTTHPSSDLLLWSAKNGGGGNKDGKEPNRPFGNVTRENLLRPPLIHHPQLELDEEGKENRSSNVARKLALGNSSAIPPNLLPRKGANFSTNKEISVQEPEKARSNGGGGGSRILAFVRLRPMAKKERDAGARSCVKIVDGRDVYLTEFATENDYLRLRRLRGRHFTFDASFPESATQQQVYSATTAELVEAVLQGRNGSVFCYGATGAGKTHTMLGTVGNPGVMVLAIKDLFAKIRQMSFDGNHVVHLSYLEVYNETVRDLLSPGRPLVLREDKQGIVAAGLTQYRAYSTDEVMALLQQGNRNRTTEPTRANETSSRSHAILQVMFEYSAKLDDASDNIVSRVGKLSLIDLAGSERALATDQRTLRSLEGANINRSLLALSSCINALVEGKKHIPYRNSKLTQLLKDSLGGACNTVMIANISPSNLVFGETQNTLHWADRAKQIRTKAYDVHEELQIPESETDQAKLVLELQKENRELRTNLASQQQKLLAIQAQNLAANAPSPAPSTVSSHLMSPAWPSEKRKTKPSFLGGGNCFTPESKKRVVDETVKELRKTVKALETEIERMKKDHAFKIKQKDSLIHELSLKGSKPTAVGVGGGGGGVLKKVITRASLRPKKPNKDELKSPLHRFVSPAPTSKKRSFWDTTSANSPSLATLNGRKTRSHVVSELTTAPSKLLQPGFALPRPETVKR